MESDIGRDSLCLGLSLNSVKGSRLVLWMERKLVSSWRFCRLATEFTFSNTTLVNITRGQLAEEGEDRVWLEE